MNSHRERIRLRKSSSEHLQTFCQEPTAPEHQCRAGRAHLRAAAPWRTATTWRPCLSKHDCRRRDVRAPYRRNAAVHRIAPVLRPSGWASSGDGTEDRAEVRTRIDHLYERLRDLCQTLRFELIDDERLPRTEVRGLSKARGNTAEAGSDPPLPRSCSSPSCAACTARVRLAPSRRQHGRGTAPRCSACPISRPSKSRTGRGCGARRVRATSMRTRSSRAASTRASAGMTWTNHAAVVRRNGWSHSVSSSHHRVTREVHPSRSVRPPGTRCRVYEELLRRVQPPHRSPPSRRRSGHFPIITPEGIVLVRARVCHRCLTVPPMARGLAAAILHNIGAWYARQKVQATNIETAADPACRLVWRPDARSGTLSGWGRTSLRVCDYSAPSQGRPTFAFGARPRRTPAVSCRHSA